ncbi:LOW QUALITY PROTEIN: hypothetical protein N5P37_005783 [Trichoderma harzianum]|nr:LOW QUALITY PROTEIN: hypothetical protein N5P37_005783 [Trichoderma harzianum]
MYGDYRLTYQAFTINMAADKVSRPTSRDEFEIAIVCTRALEYDAICLLFDESWDIDGDSLGRARGDPNTYTTGCMGKYNLVVVLLCSSGKANAAGAAASLRSSYPCIDLLILTGICEGVPDANGEELLLGDVVVSETVIQFDLGTQHVAGFEVKDTLEDRHGRANKNIRNFIANIKTEMGYQRIEEKAAAFLEKIQSRTSEAKYQQRRRATTYMYPGSANDILFESTHYHKHYNSSQCVCADYRPDEDLYAVCEDARNFSCEETSCELSSLKIRDRLHHKNLLENAGELKSAQIPSIFFGRFGSGDMAFNSGAHRDSLAKKHGIIAFEMEGAGMWDELPCIIVKGVNDYGDGHKTKKWAEWQNFAAATAASVARALIERYPQTDKPPQKAIATVAHRPLTNEELIPLINNGYHKEIIRPSEYDWEDILGRCGSFLTMRSGTIYFVHQSAKDFLVKEGSQRIFPDGMESVHREILSVSISFMRKILRKDMYSLIDPAFSMDNISQHALRDDPLVPIRYGCVYWIDHFEQSIAKGRTDTNGSFRSYELIYDFLKEKFIYWLEALSLLGGISDGIAGMQRLEQLVVYSRTPELLKVVRDACKFIQTFSCVIADYPLQVYVSALSFSPSQSLTRCQFKKQAPKWIQALAEGETEWTLTSRTYDSSERIFGLAVSGCGTWIASLHFGATVTIWETYSGKILRELDALLGAPLTERIMDRYHASELNVCFSPWNNEELVTSCREFRHHFQLMVWDVTTSKALQQLRIKDNVVTFSYLSSAHHILGILSEKFGDYYNDNRYTASIWNTKTGKIIKKIQLQISSPQSIFAIFSPTDDSTIAWYSEPHSVEIFNIDTASTMQILTDTIGNIEGMKFSPDGSSLAIKTWICPTSEPSPISVVILSDASSGEIKWSYQSEWYLQDVSFSPDGKLLAMGSNQGVELISTVSGKCLREIGIISKKLVFSSDESKMYSANWSTISVIDTDQTGAGDNSLGQKIIDKRWISLSPDGKLIASVFTNNPVIEVMEIGSTNSTYYLEVLDPIQDTFQKLLFSPDSEKLFVISRNGFTTWDISSKPAKPIFMWINPSNLKLWGNSFVFSLDSKRMASTLYIDDTYDLEYVQISESESKYGTLPQFQPLKQ